MPEYGKYVTVNSYHKKGVMDYVADVYNGLVTPALNIASMALSYGTSRNSRDAILFEVSHQQEYDAYDNAYNNYVERNRANAGDPVLQPVSLNEMPFSAFQSLVPDADENVFNNWKKSRSYSSLDRDKGYSYYATNVFDKTIDDKNNFLTRDEAIYGNYSKQIEAMFDNYLYAKDSNPSLETYGLNSTATGKGFFELMMENPDYSKYGEQAEALKGQLNAEWISSNFEVPKDMAQRWLDDNGERLYASIDNSTTVAIEQAKQAKIIQAVDSTQSLYEEKSVGVPFDKSFESFSKQMADAGYFLTDGASTYNLAVEHTRIWTDNNARAGIEADPFAISNAQIEDMVDKTYDAVMQDPVLSKYYGEALNADKEQLKSELKQYKSKQEEEQEADFKNKKNAMDSNLSVMADQGYFPSSQDIINAFGYNSFDEIPVQFQSDVAKVVANNNERKAQALVDEEYTALFYNAGAAAVSNPKGNGYTITKSTLTDATLAETQEFIDETNAKADALDTENAKSSESSPERLNYWTRMDAQIAYDAVYAQRVEQYSHFNSSGVIWNGEGSPEDGESIYTQDAGFLELCKRLGVDMSNSDLMMRLASIYSKGYEEQLNKNTFDETNEQSYATLRELYFSINQEYTYDDFLNDVYSAFADNKLSAENKDKLLSLNSNTQQTKEFLQGYNTLLSSAMSEAGLEKTDKDFAHIYNLLSNDTALQKKVNEYVESHNGAMPDITVVGNKINELISEKGAKDIRKSFENYSWAFLSNGTKRNFSSSVLNRSSDGRKDFLLYNNGEFMPWVIEDAQWWDEIKRSQYDEFNADKLLDSASQKLYGVEYSELESEQQKAVAAKNASMASYMIFSTLALAEALDKQITDENIHSVVFSDGDVGIFDSSENIAYRFDESNTARIQMFSVNGTDRLGTDGENLVIPDEAIIDTEVWDRELIDERIRKIIKETHGVSEGVSPYISGSSALPKNEYAAAKNSNAYARAISNLRRR